MNDHPRPLPPGAHDLKGRAALCAVWLLVNVLLLIKNGIVASGEAEKYIHQAHVYVSTGRLETANFRFYFVPIALLAICIRFHLSFVWMIAVQLLLNGLATLVFWRTAARLFPVGRAAFIVTAWLLLNLPYQAYNTFLQTESIFQSVSLILVCLMVYPKRPPNNRLALILVLVLILAATRPNGLLFVPVVLGFICLTALRKHRTWLKFSFLGAGVAIFVASLNLFMGSGGELDFILPFREEHIICGVPTVFAGGRAAVPAGANSIWGLLGYIFDHFGTFIRLALLKSLYFWSLCREYFSAFHNAYLVLYFYPAVVAALVSLRWWWRRESAALFYLLAPVFLTWAMVILTCDDWHNRFFLSISPFLFFLAQPLLNGDLHITSLKRPRP